MTNLPSCIEQRQKEIEKTKKLVTIGVIGSITFHGVVLSMINTLEKPLTKENSKPIELIIVKEPEIKPEKQKKPEPKIKKQEKVKQIEPTPQKLVSPQPPPTSQKTVKIPPSLPQQSTKVIKQQPTSTKSKPLESVTPNLKVEPRDEISQSQTTSASIAIEQETVTPKFKTPTPTKEIENITTTQPQEILTSSNTLAKNNTPRAIQPIEDEISNSLSNSLKSSPQLTNHSNSYDTVANISSNEGMSNSRISRNNSKTPTPISNNNGEGEKTSSLNRINSNSQNNNNNTSVASIPTNIAATSQSISQPPKSKPTPLPESIKCISNCQPSYPSALQGVEGQTTVRINLDGGGNVLGVSVVSPHGNGEVNRQALLAAQRMKFSSPSDNNASVQVRINFTVAGSEFDRLARQKKEEQETQARLNREKENQARQAQLEKERLERQQQLERERQERENQAALERERQETENQQNNKVQELEREAKTQLDNGQ